MQGPAWYNSTDTGMQRRGGCAVARTVWYCIAMRYGIIVVVIGARMVYNIIGEGMQEGHALIYYLSCF